MPIILVDRGECTFVTKVRNVENLGAKVALIGDTKEEVSEVYVMSDDGSGHSINIPSFLIRKHDSSSIKDSYSQGETVVLKVKIETAQTNSTTSVDLWYSTPFDLSTDALKSLRDSLPRLGDKVQFNLRMRTKPCLFCEELEKQRNCISDGMYCALAPTSHNAEELAYLEHLPGKSLVLQSLRARCVHTAVQKQFDD